MLREGAQFRGPVPGKAFKLIYEQFWSGWGTFLPTRNGIYKNQQVRVPLLGRLDLEVSFPEFVGVLASHTNPFLDRGFLF